MFSSTGWTPSRSSLDHITDLVYDATQDLPKTMTLRREAGFTQACGIAGFKAGLLVMVFVSIVAFLFEHVNALIKGWLGKFSTAQTIVANVFGPIDAV